MVDLKVSREEIDLIDSEIVKLFERRMEIAQNVAEYKIENGMEVFDKKREEEKLKAIRNLASNEFNQQGVEELFIQIMSISRKFQYGLVGKNQNDTSFFMEEELIPTKNTKVVFFGIKGSYTEQAMEEYFGKEITSFNEESFKGVMEAIKNNKADFGVLPIENTSTGGITDIYDLLVEYDNYIIGEHVVKIENALLGLEGASIDQLKKVYSHPQPLLQGAKFLEEHSHIEPVEYFSTAASALKVLEDNDVTQGAIAGKKTAEYYGLKVLKDSVNHNSCNSTRFIIITNKRIYLKRAKKVSICFELPHASGTLYNMLSHFIYNNLTMTQIESRPIIGKNWEYRFFIDFEGNLDESGVKNALYGIRAEASNLKVLGNF